MGELTHAFVERTWARRRGACYWVNPDTKTYCLRPRSAHPASPPEPAPESEEPAMRAWRAVYEAWPSFRAWWDATGLGIEGIPPEPMEDALRAASGEPRHAPESEEPSHDPPYDASGRIVAKSGGPDPAPEPQCACLDFWTTHHPECPRVRAGLEKAGVAAPEPEKLRRMAEEWYVSYDIEATDLVDSVARLLERVVRERNEYWLEELSSIGHSYNNRIDELLDMQAEDEATIRRLSPESAPEPKP